VADDDRTKRLRDRDGLVLRAVVDDEHRIRVPGGADDGLCDIGLLVVGRHGDERPDAAGPLPLRPCTIREAVDQEVCVLSVAAVLDDRPVRAGRRSWRAGPGGHRGPSRNILWTAGSAEARVLSGRERLWGVTGCIMVVPESGSSELPGRGGRYGSSRAVPGPLLLLCKLS